MSFGPCDVVKIKSDQPGGYVVINATDYNPEKGHELYTGESAPDHVQEPHISQAVAVQHTGGVSEDIAKAAQQSGDFGWGAQLPPVQPQAVEPAPEAPEAPAKAAKAK